MKCYCNSQKSFEQCCQPLLSEKTMAETAEQLMRSRYSAYVIGDVNYILNTHHASTRPSKERKNILRWTKSVNWQRLEVVATQNGLEKDLTGEVEFKAFFEESGKLECIHENSYFVKENKQWFYKTGTHK